MKYNTEKRENFVTADNSKANCSLISHRNEGSYFWNWGTHDKNFCTPNGRKVGYVTSLPAFLHVVGSRLETSRWKSDVLSRYPLGQTETSVCACTYTYMCNVQPDRCWILVMSGVVLMRCFYRIFEALSEVFFFLMCFHFLFLYLCVYKDSCCELTPSGFSFCWPRRSTDPKSSPLFYHKNRV